MCVCHEAHTCISSQHGIIVYQHHGHAVHPEVCGMCICHKARTCISSQHGIINYQHHGHAVYPEVCSMCLSRSTHVHFITARYNGLSAGLARSVCMRTPCMEVHFEVSLLKIPVIKRTHTHTDLTNLSDLRMCKQHGGHHTLIKCPLHFSV
jgi:hypothetical protein